MTYQTPAILRVAGYRKFDSKHPDYDYYIRVFLQDSVTKALWHVDLVPTHRNYQAWENIVEKDVLLTGFRVYSGTALDADKVPTVIEKEGKQLDLGL